MTDLNDALASLHKRRAAREERIIQVIQSCETLPQLKVAERYAKLAMKPLRNYHYRNRLHNHIQKTILKVKQEKKL